MDQSVFVWVGILGFIAAVFGGSYYFEKKRREALSEIFSRLGFEFDPGPRKPSAFPFGRLPFFQRGRNESARNIARLKSGGNEFYSCDYRYTTGTRKNKSTHHYTVFSMVGQMGLPEFRLGKEDLFSKLAQGLGYEDIDLSTDPEFSKKFVLRGSDREQVQTLFSPAVTQQLNQHPQISLEGEGGAIVRLHRGRVKPDNLVSFIEESKQLLGLFAR